MFKRFILWLFRLYSVRENVVVARSAHIGIGTIISATRNLTIGEGTYIGKGCTLQVNGSIGKGVLIANAVGLIGRIDHDYSAVGVPVGFAPWIGDPDFKPDPALSELIVEDDVWIGYGAIVLSGLRVGRGAVIAAGSVVTRDVEPYAIMAGTPARLVDRRFDDAQIVEHELGLARFWSQAQSGRPPARD